MLKNFLKLTYRNLSKNRTYVIINILGMGLSLACCIVAYLNFDFGYSFDRNHENINNLYKIHVNKEVQGELIPYGITPQPLAPSLDNEALGIQMSSRFGTDGLVMKKGDNVLNEYFGFVDDDYFDMFTYPMKYGSHESIKDKSNIILDSETAKVYFGDKNPVGEVVSLKFGDKPQKSYKVGGVLEPIPENTSMQFDGIMHYDNYLDNNDLENMEWKRFIAGTFIYVENKNDLERITTKLNEFVPIQNKARTDWLIHDFQLIPMTELGFIARDVRSNWMWSAMHPAAMYAPPIMAILMLLIACFNFTNTSIAISSRRLKEIGIRKVMGSNRKQLILQFMTENLVLCLISLVLALAISVWLVPAYGAMWEGMTLVFDLAKDYGLILFLIGLLAFTAITAGAYPSIYISSYRPVTILKGTMKIGSSKKLSYTLLTLQYVFTVMALFASIAFARNAFYQQTMDLGFERDQIVYAQVTEPKEALLLRDAIAQNSKVLSVGVGENHVGSWVYARTLSQQDFELEADMMDFGENYFSTMGLELKEGRVFDATNREYDKDYSVIVNEKLVAEFGWDKALGQRVSLNDTTTLTVVGVLKDFYYNGFWDKIAPMAYRPARDDQLRFVVTKTDLSNVTEVYELMEAEMLRIAPTKPFNGRYQTDLLKESIDVNKNIVIIFSFLGILAVILSSIGLFTLVSLNVNNRIKEIGIRKVLGASVSTIIRLLNTNFILMLSIAGVLGTVVAYFVIDALIASIFTYYKDVDLLTLLSPVLTIFIISLIVSSSRIFDSARRNPVESLRYE